MWRVLELEVELPHDDTVMPSLGMYLKDSKSTCHSDSYSLFQKYSQRQAMLSAYRSWNRWMDKENEMHISTNSFILPQRIKLCHPQENIQTDNHIKQSKT